MSVHRVRLTLSKPESQEQVASHSMKIRCESCDREIPSYDVNIKKLVARCKGCQSVFNISSQLVRVAARSPVELVPMPSSIQLIEAAPAMMRHDTAYRSPGKSVPEFQLVRRWFSAKYLPMGLFCAVWDASVIATYRDMLMNDSVPWMALLFPIAHLAVGVGLTYATVAGIFNRTTIAAGAGRLTVTHGPLPWKGNLSFDINDIAQVYCERKEPSDSEGTVSFEVSLQLKNNRSFMLLKGLPEPAQALYIEHAIESRLGIEDVPVRGELPR